MNCSGLACSSPHSCEMNGNCIKKEREPIPFFGHADLSKSDDEILHFSLDAENGEIKVEIKAEWKF